MASRSVDSKKQSKGTADSQVAVREYPTNVLFDYNGHLVDLYFWVISLTSICLKVKS